MHVEALIDNDKDKSPGAAALSYLGLTLKCENCHKQLCKVKVVRLDLPRDRDQGRLTLAPR
jgi:hypothetical protein